MPRRGVGRLVHTSTAGTCGPVAGRVATEADGPPDWELAVPYKRTKLEAERLVLAAAAEGLDALCVNPTTPVGDGDTAPTPTGRMVRGVASGRYRATLRTGGLNLVDVRDVADGHVLALERGRAGERYLLGGVNLTLAEVFALIAQAAGRRPPRLKLPYAAARAMAGVGLANRNEVALARLPAWFDSGKAARELGYEAGPIEPALARAVTPLALRGVPGFLLGLLLLLALAPSLLLLGDLVLRVGVGRRHELLPARPAEHRETVRIRAKMMFQAVVISCCAVE